MRRLCLALLLLACGCLPHIPATVPPQLSHTPGAFVRLSESHFDAGSFRLDYPPAWRIIKTSTAAAAQLEVVFAAPSGSTITLTQVAAPAVDSDSPPHQQFIRLANGITLRLRLQTAPGDANFARQAQALIASIHS